MFLIIFLAVAIKAMGDYTLRRWSKGKHEIQSDKPTTRHTPPMTRTKDQTDSALRDAIGDRDVARVQALLAAGADLTATDDEGKTPLMVAAKTGVPEVVELLLKAGADPKPKDKLGYSAEMIAYWYGEYRMGSYTAESMKIVEMLRKVVS
jgi:hypothetical protein